MSNPQTKNDFYLFTEDDGPGAAEYEPDDLYYPEEYVRGDPEHYAPVGPRSYAPRPQGGPCELSELKDLADRWEESHKTLWRILLRLQNLIAEPRAKEQSCEELIEAIQHVLRELPYSQTDAY